MKHKELRTELKNFSRIREYIEEILGQRGIDQRTKIETLLVFEALYSDMIAKGIPEDTMLQVWRIKVLGDVRIKIAFEGNPYIPVSAGGDDFTDIDGFSADDRVINAFGDKIESRYHGGRNNLTLTARRSPVRQMRINLIALLLAVLAYIPIVALIEKTGQQEMVNTCIYQMEKLFADAVLSVGAPVTFFALLRNLTGMFIAAEGNIVMRRLETKAVLTSIMSVLLAFITSNLLLLPFMILYYCVGALVGVAAPPSLHLKVQENVFEIIDSLVDSNIFDAFGSFAPFPLIFLAILTTYALCSAGTYYESIMKVIDGCYVLFSKMLSAVMYAMPVFVFLAMLEVMVNLGLKVSVFYVCLAVFVPVSMMSMILFYAVRLKFAGIKLRPFVKTMMPLLKENLVINSTIDAVPFNIRYCVTRFGLNRKKLNEFLPALARLNLDGNCFIITLISIWFIVINGKGNASAFDVIVVGIVILFLSLGAPNQPGSTLIGLLVIISYLQIPTAISLAIFSEALFGGILSMTNAAGDIVTVVIEDQKEKKLKQQKVT